MMIATLLSVYKFENGVIVVGIAVTVIVGLPLLARDIYKGAQGKNERLLILFFVLPLFCAITVGFLPFYCAKYTFARLVDNSDASHVTIIGPHGEASAEQVAEILDALQQTSTHENTYGSHERQLVVIFSQEPGWRFNLSVNSALV